ncbi:hypothetical protein LCGC14_0231560 [marine sediment metagenome]|uniref:YspA cpYpsA-related SLOG domain-containing protein n=1 Tax=marine sediment metagenome TaxID=412755 RepID=A0A0F9XE42_9ZZZZ
MKVIIAGGRDFQPSEYRVFSWSTGHRDAHKVLDLLHKHMKITEVVCGGAKGADSFGKVWAEENSIPVKMFMANWGRFGRGAGPIRNKAMADCADALIAFPGDRGTRDMLERAGAKKLAVINLDEEG